MRGHEFLEAPGGVGPEGAVLLADDLGVGILRLFEVSLRLVKPAEGEAHSQYAWLWREVWPMGMPTSPVGKQVRVAAFAPRAPCTSGGRPPRGY